MSRTPRLTDAVLRAALMPAPQPSAPPALLGAIGVEIRRTPQVRPLLRAPAFAHLADLLGPQRARQLVLLLAAAGLLAALLGGAIFAGRLTGPFYAGPVPTAAPVPSAPRLPRRRPSPSR